MIADKLRTTDILALLAIESDPCISIYLPTHKRGVETREDPIRFKNSLRQCEKRLHERGISGEKASRLLRPGHELLESSIESGNASESEEELLDEVVRCMLAQGGRIYAGDHQDMPSRSPAGAIFRH